MEDRRIRRPTRTCIRAQGGHPRTHARSPSATRLADSPHTLQAACACSVQTRTRRYPSLLPPASFPSPSSSSSCACNPRAYAGTTNGA
ncbi:unnamed protein product [Hydatigera taeniaeformis]|uniref:Uncharacterized protein n=1 Tax=Hydatigena taeniaeformis TaxID=6205 RepID=A0A0R3WNB9_HYDTA|nr:unnamed protein product [Hydatigera taeniaeformis]